MQAFQLQGLETDHGIESDAHAIAKVASFREKPTSYLTNINGAAVIVYQGLTASLKFCWNTHAEGKIVAAAHSEDTHDGRADPTDLCLHQSVNDFVGGAVTTR